jgi:hypothetical protein
MGPKTGTAESWSDVVGSLSNHYVLNCLSRLPEKNWNTDVHERLVIDKAGSEVFLAIENDCKNLKELFLVHIKAVLLCYENLSQQSYDTMINTRKFEMQD